MKKPINLTIPNCNTPCRIFTTKIFHAAHPYIAAGSCSREFNNTVGQEIRLHDLSSSETEDMLESLLKTENIPSDLPRFVQDKADGNPFYLDELVNSVTPFE